MSFSPLDPRWTDRAPTMRVLDPLGVESTEGSLQDRLLRPVLSIAITQRLRYLSFWSWVTAHLDKHTPEERALYEKLLLVGSIYHDCSSKGTGTSGIMSGTEELEEQLNDPAIEEIDISPTAFTIAGKDNARLDSYYAGILYRLLLFENEWTLTPLGRQLAEAYDNAINIEFEEVQAAVEREQLPIELIERATTGCLCQISTAEKNIITQAYWYLVTPVDQYEELAFDRTPSPDLLRLREYLDNEVQPEESDAVIEATLAGTDAVKDADYNEDLDLFFATGRDAFVRGSLVLLLSLGDWINHRPTQTPEFGPLADSREAWRLLVHSEYASHALQSIFIAILEVVKQLEPIAPDQLLSTLFASKEFDQAAGQALTGLSLSEREKDRSVLTGVRDAIYFGEAPGGPLDVLLADDADSFEGTWSDACARLRAADPDDDPFALSGHSERSYRVLLSETLSEPASINKNRRLVAYSAVQLARISTRYEQYFNTAKPSPFVNWFQTAQDQPSAYTCWRMNDSFDGPRNVIEREPHDDWSVSRFGVTMAEFTRHWILNHYFERLYEKIKDSNGKSPQLLHVDADGCLTFDHQINNGRLYNEGVPNTPTLKIDRLGDIFYELGLIEDNTLEEMQVTDRGRKIVAAFTGSGRTA